MKTIKCYYVIILGIMLVFVKNEGYCQKSGLLSDQKLPYNISSSMEIFRDTTAQLSLKEVIPKNFKRTTNDHFIFPYSDDVFWVKVTLKNYNNQNKDWFLVWTNALVEQLDFYISDPTGKGFLHKQQKLITVEKDKKLIEQDPKFAFELSPQQTKVAYIKVASKRGQYGTLLVHSVSSYNKTRIDDFVGQGFLNGLILFRMALVLILSLFVIKDRAFRLYSLYTVIKTFNYWGFLNIAGPLFTDNPDLAKKIDFLCYNSGTLGVGLFILAALSVHKYKRIHTIIVFLITAFNIFINTIIFFDYQWYWLKAGAYTIVYSSMFYIGINFYFIFKKQSFSKYYSILFIFGLLSTLILYTRLLGWIEYQPIYILSYYFFMAELFSFIFFLGRIIKNTELMKKLTEQQLNFNLEQNSRLKELDNLKTRFFTNISHEFRTPLTLLVGPIDDLQKKYPHEGIIAVMQRNLQRLQTLINQLLDLSKLEIGEMKINLQEVDLAKFLNHLYASFESLAQSKHIIFNHSQNKLSQLGLFDLDKLEKIVTNLLLNAFKFTAENGRINVRVEYLEKQISITVQDFGIGISPERLPHIFDRFYQVDDGSRRQQEGTGIGLSLVKELVDLLSGQIDVSSKVAEGTTFFLTLPFKPISKIVNPVSQFVDRINPDAVLNSNVKVNGFNVEDNEQAIMLIIEDNPDLRNYMASIFENQYQLVMAVDGEDGLAKAIEFVPDVVISDLMMPKLDGLVFCEQLKNDERINHIPVIMLTAKASLADKLVGLEKGADDYLSKPFNKEELTLRVNNLVNQRQILREKYAISGVEILPKIEVIVETTIDELFIQKATKIIDKYLDKNEFDVEMFADEMNLSSVQLRRKLKAITDQTVTEFVRNYRLEIASNMLKKSEGTVSEVAYKVGFESLSYFSKVFLEKYEKMPSEWK